jgi:hypothetical protein
MRSKAIKLLVCILAAQAFTPLDSVAQNLNFDKWEKISPAALDLTLNIAGKSHYAMRAAGKSVSSGVSTEAGEVLNATAYFTALQDGAAFGHLLLFDAGSMSGVHFGETTVTEAIRQLDYWRKQEILPAASGDFTHQRMTLRWIAFPHTDSEGKRYACFGYAASGRSVQLSLRGSWCAAGAPPFSEADVKAFVSAIGYKDILVPTPLGNAPGVPIAG